MGALSDAIAASAQAKGVEIRLNESIEEILVADGKITGIRLEGGEVVNARRVASGVDAHLTFEKMLDPSHLPFTFKRAVLNIDYASASLKINLAVSELPDFTCYPGNEEVGPSIVAPSISAPPPSISIRAYDDAKFGRPSQRPIVEMTIRTSVDKTLARRDITLSLCLCNTLPTSWQRAVWMTSKRSSPIAASQTSRALHPTCLTRFSIGRCSRRSISKESLGLLEGTSSREAWRSISSDPCALFQAGATTTHRLMACIFAAAPPIPAAASWILRKKCRTGDSARWQLETPTRG